MCLLGDLVHALQGLYIYLLLVTRTLDDHRLISAALDLLLDRAMPSQQWNRILVGVDLLVTADATVHVRTALEMAVATDLIPAHLLETMTGADVLALRRDVVVVIVVGALMTDVRTLKKGIPGRSHLACVDLAPPLSAMKRMLGRLIS